MAEQSSVVRGVTASERVFQVQLAFKDLGPGDHGTGEIARATGLNDATVSRILAAGVYEGIFRRAQGKTRGRWQLGQGSAAIGFNAIDDAYSAQMPTDKVKAVLTNLHEKTDSGLTFLYTRATGEVPGRQCVEMGVGESDLEELNMTTAAVLSVTRSLRTGASGRTILAYLGDSLVQRVIAQEIPPHVGPGVIRDDAELLASLQTIRDRGYALGYQECMAEWHSCAAPVFWDDTITASVLLLKKAELGEIPEAYVTATVRAAAQLSGLRGGWPGALRDDA
ncbi:IclR family transcriptional regulator C-terminal domain-containing protein [Streptomyces sp. NPDC014872]|uniref:IclR family transcriptional regulator domain-containing protein n=1 Tax=Streptomyces sp. NPDC014872 TaxID=3364926 RepID=UPI0036F54B28